jgi:O-antigen/teichoic acid export membrane protein
MSSQSRYRQIFKATSLFGGVQIVNILTIIIRAKFVAIFIGPAGMGIYSLLVSTVTLISTISGMGLNYSAIRNISQANESGDLSKLSSTLFIFRRLILISSLIGALLLIIFSPFLSQFAFGNRDYTWSFISLSLMLVFTTLTSGNTALLQGTRKLAYTAKSSIIGSVLGLMTSVPLYYFLGLNGIMPSLIVSALTAYIISWFFASKVEVEPVKVTKDETITVGTEMIKLGGVLVTGQLLGSLIVYIINTFIRNKGGLVDVGLYQAGMMMTSQSIGLVFSAMSIDYFPRLAGVCNDREKVNNMVNEQGIITALIASPLLIALIVFAPVCIHILLSPKFYVIQEFVRWLAFGTLFTAPIIVISYIALAKGDKTTYFLYGSVYNSVLSLFIYMGGYLVNGLIGMAVGFLILQVSYLIIISVKFYKLYAFSFKKNFLSVFVSLALLCSAAMLSTILLKGIWIYAIGSLISALSFYYAWVKLDSLLGLRQILLQKNLRNK